MSNDRDIEPENLQDAVTQRTPGADMPRDPTTGGGQRSQTDQQRHELEVDAYLVALDPDHHAALQRVRKIVRELVPQATERMRYKVPTFMYRGPLVGYAVGKGGCSFFVMSRAVMEAYKQELDPYYYGPGILKFSHERPLPAALIQKLVRVRVAENRAKKKS